MLSAREDALFLAPQDVDSKKFSQKSNPRQVGGQLMKRVRRGQPTQLKKDSLPRPTPLEKKWHAPQNVNPNLSHSTRI
jgi:hypothetical protein